MNPYTSMLVHVNQLSIFGTTINSFDRFVLESCFTHIDRRSTHGGSSIMITAASLCGRDKLK